MASVRAVHKRGSASTFGFNAQLAHIRYASSTYLVYGSACSECGFVLSDGNGILRSLPSDRELYFRAIHWEYELVRTKEGRGSSSTDYYLALPFKDLTGRNSWQWKIRAKTWRHMAEHLLPQIERSFPQGCDVLDIGAGNCWLSYRMTFADIVRSRSICWTMMSDGLGAARHY